MYVLSIFILRCQLRTSLSFYRACKYCVIFEAEEEESNKGEVRMKSSSKVGNSIIRKFNGSVISMLLAAGEAGRWRRHLFTFHSFLPPDINLMWEKQSTEKKEEYSLENVKKSRKEFSRLEYSRSRQ